MSELREQARGRWHGILPALGIPPQVLTGQHGPCPFCGGKDRWRFDDQDGRGTWFCTHCGAGDGVALVMRAMGVEFQEAAKMIEAEVGSAPVGKAAAGKPDEAKARKAKNDIWIAAAALGGYADPVTIYLHARGIFVQPPPALRCHPHLRYQDGLEGAPSFHPAMIAMVTGADGKAVTLHRTYLTADGRKADVPKPKKVMPGGGSMAGKAPAIRLMPISDGVLGVAEGIENALSAALIHGVPCWALVSSGLMKTWEPPPEVTAVWIFGDNDPHYAGLAAASALAHRLSRDGRQVMLTMPERAGEDWNLVLLRERP